MADLALQIQARHPDPFTRIDSDSFQDQLDELHAEIPFLSDPQIVARLMTIAVLLRDGHTALNPFTPASRFVPIQLYFFSDGLFVVDARPPFEPLIGRELIRIGERDVRDAVLSILPLTPADNPMTPLSVLPLLMMTSLLLEGTGVVGSVDEIPMTFRDGAGTSVVTFEPISLLEATDWISGLSDLFRLPVRSEPLYVSNTERFWFTHLAASNTLYIQYNNVFPTANSGETLSQFVERIEMFLSDQTIDRTVVDLRHNNGGDNTTFGPLLNLLKEHPQISLPGRLFVITGRRTFSAAQNFVTRLERESEAVFVGEPAGGSPNHYGDSITSLLPNSRLALDVSSIFHQDAPGDPRFWIPPDLAVTLSSSDYFNEADPVLGAILEPESAEPIEADFSVPQRGVFSRSTAAAGNAIPTVGYAQIEQSASFEAKGSGGSSQAGFAAFTLRQNGILVSEASVLAAPLTRRARIHASIEGSAKTGIAIANPGVLPAKVSYQFTDSEGEDFGQGSVIVPANGQIARFLDEPPFNGGTSLSGAITLDSDGPVGLTALRGTTNERSEFLITAVPVVALDGPPSQANVFPQFVAGQGWTSEVLLVNPGEERLAGTLSFRSPGQPDNDLAYDIAPRSSTSLKVSDGPAPLNVGFAVVVPSAGSQVPAGTLVYSSRQGGVLVTEAAVGALPSLTQSAIYVEKRGPLETGIAVANPGDGSVEITVELFSAAGEPVGTTSFEIAAGGHRASFLNELEGLQVPQEFEGTMRVTAPAQAGVAVTGLRSRFNERNNFLIAATPTLSSGAEPAPNGVVFPHLVEGGGFVTQFVLLRGEGQLRFFRQLGNPLSLGLSGFDP